MIFDITNIDLVILIQALYANSKPNGVGIMEYAFKKKGGLSIEETKILLNDNQKISYKEKGRIRYDLDSVNGVPLNFYPDWIKGRLLFNSTFFDYEHGNYRFLEILLHTFLLDEISIARKEYGDRKRWDEYYYKFSLVRENKYRELIRKAKKEIKPYGIRWQLY